MRRGYAKAVEPILATVPSSFRNASRQTLQHCWRPHAISLHSHFHNEKNGAPDFRCDYRMQLNCMPHPVVLVQSPTHYCVSKISSIFRKQCPNYRFSGISISEHGEVSTAVLLPFRLFSLSSLWNFHYSKASMCARVFFLFNFSITLQTISSHAGFNHQMSN